MASVCKKLRRKVYSPAELLQGPTLVALTHKRGCLLAAWNRICVCVESCVGHLLWAQELVNDVQQQNSV